MGEREIIVVGAGGHARVLIDVLRASGVHPAGAVDADPNLHGSSLDGVPVLGGDDWVLQRNPAGILLVNGQGNVPSVGSSGLSRRRRLFESFVEAGYTFISVVSPSAIVSEHAKIAAGAQILVRAVVNAGVRVEKNAIVNTGAQLDHDCVIGAHSHVAPGAVLCGGIEVGEMCHIGAGAVLIPQIKVGAGATIGAGAAVTADVPPGRTVLGVPAKTAG